MRGGRRGCLFESGWRSSHRSAPDAMGEPPPTRPSVRREARGTGLYWTLVVAFLLAVGILIGIIQNLQAVEFRYLGWDLRTPLVVILLATVLAVLVLAELVGLLWRRQRRRRLADRHELLSLRERPAGSVVPTAAELENRPPPPPPPPLPA